MNNEYYITCARCNVTFTGMRADADLAFKAHEQLAHNYMTGEQFYERFVRELDKQKFPNILTSEGKKKFLDYPGVIKAAKRATKL